MSTADITIGIFAAIFVANFFAAAISSWTPDPAISGACSAVIGAALVARGRSDKANGDA